VAAHRRTAFIDRPPASSSRNRSSAFASRARTGPIRHHADHAAAGAGKGCRDGEPRFDTHQPKRRTIAGEMIDKV
jgi:hypothetical protein